MNSTWPIKFFHRGTQKSTWWKGKPNSKLSISAMRSVSFTWTNAWSFKTYSRSTALQTFVSSSKELRSPRISTRSRKNLRWGLDLKVPTLKSQEIKWQLTEIIIPKRSHRPLIKRLKLRIRACQDLFRQLETYLNLKISWEPIKWAHSKSYN